MSRIHELDPHVADLIAAGEVVERPASVVKELVENAVDAGAQRVQVEIKRGGLALIRVSDNGEGIEAEDLPSAFLRHATSKISVESDLENIVSMGFRGEALASIAAVAKVQVYTRTRGAVEGACYRIEGGTGGEVQPAGCPEGTVISVEELFYNTPARQKFIKRDSAEASRVVETVTALALAHPEIAFKLVSDGETVLSSQGGGLKAAVYDLLGATLAAGLVAANNDQSGVRVTGFVSKPTYGHGNRRKQHFFVNRRPVSSKLLMAALEQGYKNRMVQGRFPACVLHIQVPPAVVDVNVHPAKSEVKFAFERDVFDAVYVAVCGALEQSDLRASIGHAAPKFTPDLPGRQQEILKDHKLSGGVGEFYREMQKGIEKDLSHEKLLEIYKKSSGKVTFHKDVPQDAENGERVIEISKPAAQMPPPESVRAEERPAGRTEPEETPEPKAAVLPLNDDGVPAPTEAAEPEPPKAAIASWRILGEAFSTYIIVEDGDELVLIDKHAAHERMIFDRLVAAGEKPLTQYLITPEVVTLGRVEAAAIREHLDELERFGFEISEFGGESFVLRALPSELDREDAQPTLEQMAENFIGHKRMDMLERREEIMRLVACKAAIKAGMHTTPEERKVLVEHVMGYRDVQFCPHGRPVAAVLSRAELEQRIDRRV